MREVQCGDTELQGLDLGKRPEPGCAAMMCVCAYIHTCVCVCARACVCECVCVCVTVFI
jgi:hypothetical protein